MESHKILFESLDKAEQHFEAGEIRIAQKLVNEVSRSIKSQGRISNKLRHKFNFMSAQSRYFNDISSFATNPKRNEIIKEIENLISTPHENPKKQANEIHGLQTKWQLLDQTSKPAGREQWIAFKDLTDKAWEPCAQYYEELKVVKINNAAEREKLINSLIEYTKSNEGKWPSLIEMSKFLSKTFRSWQNFAPVLDEDFLKLKSAYQNARKPINEAIKQQENKNLKLKEALIEKVKLINDEDNQASIQKFKKIKREYQDIGPAGKKNETNLWKSLNQAADKFFEAEKSLVDEELQQLNELAKGIQSETTTIHDVKNKLKDLNKIRKSPEFLKLQKDIKSIEKKQKEASTLLKVEAYQNLTKYLEASEDQGGLINKDISRVLQKPQYINNIDALNKSTIMLEIIGQVETPAVDKKLKQEVSLRLLQDKFSTQKSTQENIQEIFITFVNNLGSKDLSANEKKLWQRIAKVIPEIASDLP